MDSWPVDNRIRDSTNLNRKGKRKEENSALNYPIVQQGSLAAITLIEKKGQFHWASASRLAASDVADSNLTWRRKKSRKLYIGSPITVFPPTRPPPLHIPRTTILQRAEQGANFLRRHLPDVDVAAEIIRDEVAEDTTIGRNLEIFDPLAGNLIETVESPSKKSTYLAFPMGELNRELNLSLVRYSLRNSIIFKPSANPVRTFDTPIRQVVSSKTPSEDVKSGTFLAIRTFGPTSLLEVKANMSGIHLNDLATIMRADVGNHPVTDIKLSSSPIEAFLVNDHGALYKYSHGDGHKHLNLIHAAPDSPTDAVTDVIWRVSLGDDTDCTLASSKYVKHLDLRTNTSVNLFSVAKQEDLITSIEDDQEGDTITRLCTTNQIIWLDKRYPGRPLLGYQHGRQYDRSLAARTVYLKSAFTFLSSRNNSLMTVYDVSRSKEGLIQVKAPPRCFSTISNLDGFQAGQCFFANDSGMINPSVSIFTLSDRGAINHLDIHSTKPSYDHTTDVEWSADIEALNIKTSKLRSEVGPLDAQDSSEVDLFPAYDRIFRTHAETLDKIENENGERVYELLDKIPSYWQSSDAPVDHMLTTYDIAFRSGDEPAQASRADFLTGSIVNSARGYRALVQGRLSAQALKKGALWHHDIRPILKHLDVEITGDTQQLAETFHSFDLAADSERPAQSFKRESEAREQLALDLTLSADIFSSVPFSRPPEAGLETMTEALSLGGEPPSVDFGYLRPVPKDYYSKFGEGDVPISPGVRSLLRDWELGTNPQDFIYQSPYDTPNAQPAKSTVNAQTNAQSQMPVPMQTQTQTQTRPPLVVASTSIAASTRPNVPNRLFVGGQSQGAARVPGVESQIGQVGDIAGSSQEYMTSTQILPGPHGGRVPIGKKKVVKKRLGGF